MKKTELIELYNLEEFKLSNVLNQILWESYTLIGENIDLGNTYEYQRVQGSKGSQWFEFNDNHNVVHEIRMTYDPTTPPTLRVKFWWNNPQTNKPDYNKPPFTDEKIFNTHMRILNYDILPFFKANIGPHFGINELIIEPTDDIRYRLYRIALNQTLDKNQFELIENKPNLFIKIK